MSNDSWLELQDDDINVTELMQRIRERVAQREGTSLSQERPPEEIAQDLWNELIGPVGGEIQQTLLPVIRQQDCDIVPRSYVIDWHVPILGPINAMVRRIINAEIRRYLLPVLEKQSSLNRKLARALRELAQENARLRQELEELQRR